MLENLITKLRHKEYTERIKRLEYASKNHYKIRDNFNENESIHIVYVLNHVGVCGGVKIILEHANGLTALGARVTLISHFPKPDWFNIQAEYKQVPFQIELTREIPDCDVIVATYWEHINACVEMGIAPVVYFEQGDFHLFEQNIPADLEDIIYKQYQLPFEVIAVSKQISKIIMEKFNRKSIICQNALNRDVFYPKRELEIKKSMIIVGSEQNNFKGINDLKKVYLNLCELGYELDLIWITQHEPNNPLGRVYVSPDQEMIGKLYREAFIYVSGSHYESFPLPPLEAMACGTPVVTTNNVGVLEYGVDNFNCLMSDIGDVESLTKNIVKLINDKELYQKLQSNGYETSATFNWGGILSELLDFYKKIAGYEIVNLFTKEEWVINKKLELQLNEYSKKNLNKFLNKSQANEVYFPVQYDAVSEFSIIKWERLAYRVNFNNYGLSDKYYKIIKSDSPYQGQYPEIVKKVIKKKYADALAELSAVFINLNPESLEYPICARWIIYCLIKLNYTSEAIDLLEATISNHPFNSDLIYLFSIVYKKNRNIIGSRTAIEIYNYVQEGAFYSEYIDLSSALTHWDNINEGDSDMFEYYEDIESDVINTGTVTVFSLTVGDPVFKLSKESIQKQAYKDFTYKIIENVAPFNAACALMIESVKTEFFIQVDEDMILYPEAVLKMKQFIERTPENIGMVCFHLWDADRELKIQGIKIYRTKLLKQIKWNDLKASEIDILDQFKEKNIQWVLHDEIVGDHGVSYTPETIYLRYKTMYEKDLGVFNIISSDIYRKVLKFRESGGINDLFAILGSVHGIVNSYNYTDKEKDYRLYGEQAIEIMKKLFFHNGNIPTYQKYQPDKEYILKNQPLDYKKFVVITTQDILTQMSLHSSIVYSKIQLNLNDEEVVTSLNKIIDNLVLLNKGLLPKIVTDNYIEDILEDLSSVLVEIISYMNSSEFNKFSELFITEYIKGFELLKKQLYKFSEIAI